MSVKCDDLFYLSEIFALATFKCGGENESIIQTNVSTFMIIVRRRKNGPQPSTIINDRFILRWTKMQTSVDFLGE